VGDAKDRIGKCKDVAVRQIESVPLYQTHALGSKEQ
jgi:hypothetical protein